jgi:hypothetical protein
MRFERPEGSRGGTVRAKGKETEKGRARETKERKMGEIEGIVG